MRKYKRFKCVSCIPLDQKPLIVSGRGYTEYEINFCKVCGRVIGKLIKDFEDIYSVEESR